MRKSKQLIRNALSVAAMSSVVMVMGNAAAATDLNDNASMLGIVGTGAATQGIVGTGAATQGIVGTGAAIQGIVGTGAATQGIVGTGAATQGIVGTGAATQGIVGTGAATQGIVGTGAATQGIVGTGAATQGIVGTGRLPLVAYGPIEQIIDGGYLVLGQSVTTLGMASAVPLQVGDTVMVFGMVSDDGIVADQVVLDERVSIDGSSFVFLAGIVDTANPHHGTYTIGRTTIQIGSAGASPESFDIQRGQYVEVIGFRFRQLVIAENLETH